MPCHSERCRVIPSDAVSFRAKSRNLHVIFRKIFLIALASPLAAQSPAFSHAKKEFDAHNWDAATSEFAALAKATPSGITPVMYLGKIALSRNDIDESVKQFERCAQIDERNAECHAWLGNALGSAAQHASKFRLPFLAKRVKTEFERAVQLDPKNGEGRCGLLQYYMQAPGFLGGSMERARSRRRRTAPSRTAVSSVSISARNAGAMPSRCSITTPRPCLPSMLCYSPREHSP